MAESEQSKEKLGSHTFIVWHVEELVHGLWDIDFVFFWCTLQKQKEKRQLNNSLLSEQYYKRNIHGLGETLESLNQFQIWFNSYNGLLKEYYNMHYALDLYKLGKYQTTEGN